MGKLYVGTDFVENVFANDTIANYERSYILRLVQALFMKGEQQEDLALCMQYRLQLPAIKMSSADHMFGKTYRREVNFQAVGKLKAND